MSLFWRFVWPRSWRSLSGWVPLLIVVVMAAIGLSLALGLRSGVLRQSATATLRGQGSGQMIVVGLGVLILNRNSSPILRLDQNVETAPYPGTRTSVLLE